MQRIGLRNRPATLYRVHVMDRRVGKHAPHNFHFRQARAVEMPHSAFPQRAQHGRIGVALDRIHRRAGEAAHERLCVSAQCLLPQTRHRLLGPQGRHQVVDRRQGADGKLSERSYRSGSQTGAQFGHGTKPSKTKRESPGQRVKARGRKASRSIFGRGAPGLKTLYVLRSVFRRRAGPVSCSKHSRIPQSVRPTNGRFCNKGRVTS